MGFPWIDKWPVLSSTITAVVSFSLTVLMMQGCESGHQVDQCERKRVFRECLESAPDRSEMEKLRWSEVVRECESASYQMAVRRHSQHVKKACLK